MEKFEAAEVRLGRFVRLGQVTHSRHPSLLDHEMSILSET